MDLSKLRKDYLLTKLDEELVCSEPMDQLKKWIDEARDAQCLEYSAMALATVGENGQPSVRTVLLKYLKPEGLYFFTNYESRKGREMSENQKVAALFFWPELERQVKIEGIVHKAPPEVSDHYFNERPFESQISALVSRQSTELPDRETLEELWQAETVRWQNRTIKRPDYWGGYQLKPMRMEFWQGRPFRLHDRIQYKKMVDGWKIVRLSP